MHTKLLWLNSGAQGEDLNSLFWWSRKSGMKTWKAEKHWWKCLTDPKNCAQLLWLFSKVRREHLMNNCPKYKYWKTVYSMGQKYILLRGIFRTLSNMCDGALKIGDCVNCIEPLTIYTKCSSLDVWKVLDTLMLMQPEEETNAIVGTIKVIYKAEI